MAFFRLFSLLPFSILYLVSDFLFFMSFYVVRYRKKMVRKNLTNSFPHKSMEEIKNIEKEFYKNLCDYAVETIKLLTIPKEDLARRMVFSNLDLVQQYKDQNLSLVILSSHQFNWEWLLVSGSFSLPFPTDFVYQTVNNEFFEKFSLAIRTRFGAHAIKRDEVGRELIRRKNIQRGIAIIADQYPGLGKDKKYFTTFLNQRTVFFQGANQISILTQFPAVFAAVKKVKRGFYEATFVPIAEPPYEKTDVFLIENYIKAVEKNISEEPAGWLWSHNRWKKRHQNGDELH